MTRYLRNQEGEFSTWAKGVLATLVIGFVGFTLTASARVVFGGPVEAKIQEIEKTSLREDIKKLSDRMDLLEKQGHKVFTPTLTGLGERSHLLRASINVSTHVTDVVNVLKWERLTDVGEVVPDPLRGTFDDPRRS